MKLKIRFLRVNERHHSVAIANVSGAQFDPIRTRVQHVNIQAATLDDMLQAVPTRARARLRDGLVGRPAHQRQGAVVLLRDAVRLRARARLEPDLDHARAGVHLGAHHATRASASGATPPVDPGIVRQARPVRQAARNARQAGDHRPGADWSRIDDTSYDVAIVGPGPDRAHPRPPARPPRAERAGPGARAASSTATPAPSTPTTRPCGSSRPPVSPMTSMPT